MEKTQQLAKEISYDKILRNCCCCNLEKGNLAENKDIHFGNTPTELFTKGLQFERLKDDKWRFRTAVA